MVDSNNDRFALFDLSEADRRICQQTCDWFNQQVTNASIVSPSDFLRGRSDTDIKLPASGLTLDEHFKVNKISSLGEIQVAKVLKGLRDMIASQCNVLCAPTSTVCVTHAITECSHKIMKKLVRCQSIRNEAELRYVVGDPIMEMLCETFKLRVKL